MDIFYLLPAGGRAGGLAGGLAGWRAGFSFFLLRFRQFKTSLHSRAKKLNTCVRVCVCG